MGLFLGWVLLQAPLRCQKMTRMRLSTVAPAMHWWFPRCFVCHPTTERMSHRLVKKSFLKSEFQSIKVSLSVHDGPISVYFKIPVSEVSKIDDQRSQISIRWTYKLKWPEPRMILNASADWSKGELNVRGDMVDHFWTPDIIIHDLVSFYKPEVLNQVAALEIKQRKQLYFKVR